MAIPEAHQLSELEEVQLRVFTRWVNWKLKKTGVEVGSLEVGLESGVKLFQLLEVLAPGKKLPKYHKKPSKASHKTQNLSAALSFITETEKIDLDNIATSDITDQNLSKILSLVRSLILHYHLKEPKEALLEFLNAALPGRDISDFSTNWRDGSNLTALVNYCKPDLVKSATLEQNGTLQNITNVMDLAEKELHVPQLLTYEDLATESPDELCVMIYISCFFIGASSPVQHALLSWIKHRIPSQKIGNFSDDWKNGIVLAALVNAVSKGQFSAYQKMSTKNSKGLDNCREAMEAAENILGIEKRFEPEDFHNPKFDTLKRMAYLVQFHNIKLPPKVLDLHIPEKVALGEVVWLDIECSEEDSEAINASAEGNEVGQVPVKVDILSKVHCKYRIRFSAKEADVYTFSVQVGENRVRGSPFRISLTPPDASKVAHKSTVPPTKLGEPAVLSFDISEAGRGVLVAEIMGKAVGSTPVKVDQTSLTDFRVVFVPTHPDVYSVHVMLDSKPVKGSPFEVDLQSLTQPEKVKCGELLYGDAGETARLPVDHSSAGKGKVMAECVGQESGAVEVEVNYIWEGHSEITFTPGKDLYTLSVFFEGVKVYGSPFCIDLRPIPPQPEEVTILETPSGFLNTGEEIAFIFNTSRAGQGRMTASCAGKKVGDVPIEVMKHSHLKSTVNFTPEEQDIYNISVFWAGEHIRGSPFAINVIPKDQPDPNKVQTLGVEKLPQIPLVNEPIKFQVNTAGAGKGSLDVKVRDPAKKTDHQLEIKPTAKGSPIYDVTYTPTVPGEHELYLTWAKEVVPNSPVVIHVTSPQPFIYGRRVSIPVDVESRRKDMRAFALPAGKPTRSQLKAKVNKISHGHFEIVVEPKHTGIYYVHVLSKDKEIKESPFVVNYTKESKPEACVVHGLMDVGYVGVPIKFTVDTTKAGIGKLTIQARGKAECKGVVTDNEDGTYSAEFTPTSEGDYEIDMRLAGAPIPGNPFKIVIHKRKEVVDTGEAVPAEEDSKPDEGDTADLEVITTKPLESSKPIPDEPPHHNNMPVPEIIVIPDTTKEKAPDDFIPPPSPEQVEISTPESHAEMVATDTMKSERSDTLRSEMSDIDTERPGRTSSNTFRSERSGSVVSTKSEGSNSPNLTTPLSGDIITGLNLENEKFRVGVPYKLKLHCEDIGNDHPDIKCEPASGADISLPPALGTNSYWFKITPKETGQHMLSVQYKGAHILGSPFHVNFSPHGDASKCEMINPIFSDCQQRAGNNAVICISTKGAGRGKMTAFVKSLLSKKHLPVSITHPYKHHYNVEFDPTEGKNYILTIKYDDEDIQGSPFHFELGDPTQCHIDGDGIYSAQINKLSKFSVSTENAGPGNLGVSVEGEEEMLEPTITTIDSNHFEVSYLPTKGGPYKVFVRWSGVNIPGSPFEVACIDPSLVNVVECITESFTGRSVKFNVTPSLETQDERQLTISAQSDAHIVPGQVEKVDELTYSCIVNPPAPGTYSVHICWGGVHINGSPLELKVTPAPTPEDFTVKVAELDSGSLGVDVSGPSQAFNYGKLTASVINEVTKEKLPVTVTIKSQSHCTVEFRPILSEGIEYTLSSKKHLPVTVTHHYKHHCNVESDPTKCNDYVLTIKYNDENIQGSPFHLELGDPTQCRVDGDDVYSAQINKLSKFSISTENAGHGNLGVSVEGEEETLESTITTIDSNHFEVSYLPTKGGFYKVFVRWSGVNIPGSPFEVTCIDPSLVNVMERITESYMGRSVKFNVTAPLETQDERQLTISAQSDAHIVPGQVEKVDELTFSCIVNPPAPGTYLVHICWGSVHINGSPLELKVTPAPTPEDFTVKVAELDSGSLGVDVSGPSQAFNYGKLTASVINEVTKEKLPVTVTIRSQSHCTVEFKPILSEGIEYTLSIKKHLPVMITHPYKHHYNVEFDPTEGKNCILTIKYDDENIQGSPFHLELGDPTQCRIDGDGIYSAQINKLSKFSISTENAGHGNLGVSVEGEEEMLEPTITTIDSNHCEVSYLPTKGGPYKVFVRWSGVNIPGSPFEVACIDPSLVNVVECITESFTGRSVKFNVTPSLETQDERQLTISAQSDAHIVPGQVEKVDELTYSCIVNPPAPGTYSVHICWGGVHINGSPLELKVTPAPTPEDFTVKVAELDSGSLGVDVSGPSQAFNYGKLTVSVINEVTKEKLPVTVTIKSQSHCTVEFRPILSEGIEYTLSSKKHLPVTVTHHYKHHCNVESDPTKCNDYVLTIKYNDENIQGSPFHLELGDPTQCRVDGDDVYSAQINKLSKFSISTENAGHGNLGVSVEGEEETLEPTITTIDSNHFEVSYLPTKGGPYKVFVRWSGVNIPGSPFEVACIDPSLVNVVERITESFTGRSVKFNVTPSLETQDESQLTISAQSDAHVVPGQVEKVDELTYSCIVNPPAPGTYSVHICWGGVHINGSPLELKVTPAPTPEDFTVKVAELDSGSLGVDVSGPSQAFNYGKLTASVINEVTKEKLPVTVTIKSQSHCTVEFRPILSEGIEYTLSSKKHLPVTVTHHYKHHCNVESDPTKCNDYVLTIKYNDENIQGSPFHLELGDPTQCRVDGDDVYSAQINKLSKFSISTENAGHGNLGVSVEGEEETLEPTITTIDSNHFEVSYLPTKGGPYKVFVHWSGVNIPGSPFEVACIDPSLVNVVERITESFTGRSVKFNVTPSLETQDESQLTISAQSDAHVVPGQVEKVDELTYSCIVNPPAPGTYSVHICWGGVHINGSPLELKVTPAPTPEDFTVKVAELDSGSLGVDVSGPSQAFKYEELTASVINEVTKEKLPVTVTIKSQSHCTVEFRPILSEGIKYTLSIKYEGEPINGSPFALMTTDASLCTTNGKGLRFAKIGEWNYFTVHAENAGMGELKVYIEGEGEVVEPLISAAENKMHYHVDYMPKRRGIYTIAVKWGFEHVPNSPYKVYSSNPTKFCIKEHVKDAPIGIPIKFDVETQQTPVEWEKLSVVACSKRKEDIHGEVKQGEGGKYKCFITIPETGKYVIHVRCNGFEISESPFRVRLMPATVPENVQVYGPGLKDGSIGQEGTFTISVAEAGYGCLSFRVEGPKGAFKIHLKQHPDEKCAILAQYNPLHAGKYTISVLWAGVHIPGSPFNVSILEAEEQDEETT